MFEDIKEQVLEQLLVAKILLQIVAIWILSDIGFYVLTDLLGVGGSYSSHPFWLALYYLFWVGVALWTFAGFYRSRQVIEVRASTLVVGALGGAVVAGYLLFVFPLFPPIGWATLWRPPTELLYASGWYFLPKSIDILLQQLLIAAMVFAFNLRKLSVPAIARWSAGLFGSMHLLLVFGGSSLAYVCFFTAAAAVAGYIFPYLMLRVRNGFVYAYFLHWGFYAVVIVLIRLVFALPLLPTTAAQEASTPYDYWTSETGAVQPQSIEAWRHASPAIEQKIATLPASSNPAVAVPVLFGVGVKNLVPNFGDPRLVGRTHEGEDIPAVKGDPVVSPTVAVVIQAGVGPREGNYVVTANPGGETYVYMHLSAFGAGVTSGALLGRGSLIGYVGDTGNALGGPSMLHFEIRNTSDAPTDPYPRLSSAFSPQEKKSYLAAILMQTFGANALLQRDLYRGAVGEDVRTLQKILNWDGYAVAGEGPGSAGQETAYFGPATEAAVIKFQTARGIVPAVGRAGPATRGALTAL